VYVAAVARERHYGASRIRALIDRTPRDPAQFRATLAGVPPGARDACVDGALGLDELPVDGPALPSGCVPYLPCPVDTLLRVVEHAPVRAADVFVDVGSGVGRAAALVHLLTGARAVGLEVQQSFVAAARALATRLRLPAVSFVEGDAPDLAPALADGSVFLLYCPFSGDRLEKLLACLEPIARTRTIHICCVDLPLPPRDWLTLASAPSPELAIYRSTSATARQYALNGGGPR
jgi:SAM-dependent methyltransferase